MCKTNKLQKIGSIVIVSQLSQLYDGEPEKRGKRFWPFDEFQVTALTLVTTGLGGLTLFKMFFMSTKHT